jgi:hypothetical protein
MRRIAVLETGAGSSTGIRERRRIQMHAPEQRRRIQAHSRCNMKVRRDDRAADQKSFLLGTPHRRNPRLCSHEAHRRTDRPGRVLLGG